METLLVTNPEKVQLIHPPMRIMGSTLVTLPFIMSVSMLGSRQHMDETVTYLKNSFNSTVAVGQSVRFILQAKTFLRIVLLI